jgi:hypothetical protein
MPYKDVRRICKDEPNLCKDHFWIGKAIEDFKIIEDKSMYPYADDYYNYLAARVREINRLRLMYPTLNPKDFGIKINDISLLSENDLRAIATSIDNAYLQKRLPSLRLTQEKDIGKLRRKIYNYFLLTEQRLRETPELEEKANRTSLKIVRYLEKTYPDNFYYDEIEREGPYKEGRNPIPDNYEFRINDFIIVNLPYDEKQVIFATRIGRRYIMEIVNYPDGKIRRVPPLFQEFLERMGLTYKAANELYGYVFPRSETWI